MVKACCVKGCMSGMIKDALFFKLPTVKQLRQQWMDVIKPSTKLPLNASICSLHFLESDYESVRGKIRLKRSVVPSIFDAREETNTSPNERNKSQVDTSQTNITDTNPDTNPDTSTDITAVAADRKTEIEIEVNVGVILNENGTNDENSDRNSNKSPLQEQHSPLTNGIPICPDILDPDILDHDTPIPSPDLTNHDIEDILTNYHIKQTKPLHATYSDDEVGDRGGEKGRGDSGENGGDIVDLDNMKETPPVFIEIPVDKGRNQQASDREDCLMLLESVQCDIDPSALMLPERTLEEVEGVIGDDDDDDVKVGDVKRKQDAISLLTSSDDDDVIIEEPHIDTVEVSDETDEDDVPLVKLVKSATKQPKARKSEMAKIFWGTYDYYCVECHFSSTSRAEYEKHRLEQHSNTVLQICQLCGYTTASEGQFSRHKKKHKEERRFKCHLCDYKARHNMSLIYHMKTHASTKISVKKAFKCDKCGFKSNIKSKMLKHIRLCDMKKYSCDLCRYDTKRKSDLKRHKLSRHREDWDCESDL